VSAAAARLGAGLATLLPLVGLLTALGQPAADPFGAASPGLGELLGRSGALALLGRTLALALCATALAVPLGTWLAWVEQRTEYPGRAWLGVADLLPLAVPSYILAAALRESLGPGGALGAALGLPRFTGFGPAVLALALIGAPYVQLLVGAALLRLSAAEEEAARLLGASRARVFRAVVLPRLRPTLAFAALLSALYAVSDFGAVAVLDCPVLTWRLYQAVHHQELGRAALLGLALLAATLPLLVAARALHGGLPRRASVANPRPPQRRALRGVALLATGVAHAALIGLGVALPVVALASWCVAGWRHGLEFASPWLPLGQSLGLALGGALLTLGLALAPAWVAARTRRARFAAALEHGTYLTGALPGVLLGFGLLLVALAVSRAFASSAAIYHALLGSGALLGLGYALRFATEGYAGLKAAIVGLDARHEECARTLGARRGRWLARVVLPAVAPGAAASFVLLFLSVLKELPVTLLLGGAMGLRPLSFRMYDRYAEAFLHDAGLAGLLIVGLALVGVLATLRYRRHV
jgi:iron(III) transport system permease protein